MNRLAIFVEGETEQLFAQLFVREMANSHHLHVELREALGGRKSRRRTRIVEVVADDAEVKHYVLIVDCHGDGGVKSRIREEYDRLVKAGYNAVIGMRDAPRRREGIPILRAELPSGIPTSPLAVVFVISIMEIEAWFLAEHSHFEKLDPNLTPELIQQNLGFRPGTDDMRERDHPALDIDSAYGLVGRRYQKGRAAQQTLYLLDYARIAFVMAEADDDIRSFVEVIQNFLDAGQGMSASANT